MNNTNPDLKKILAANPQLDQKRIEELVAYRERMERAGYTVRTTYRVEPALGSLASLSPHHDD